MAWWHTLLGIKSSTVGPESLWRELFGGRETKAGQVVNIRTALETGMVLACGRVIAEGLAQVPCKIFLRGDGGSRTEARDHPLFDLLQVAPNEYQTSFEFLEQIGLHAALCGNAYVFKNRLGNGKLVELLPFEPGWVTVTRLGDYSLTYKVQTPDGRSFEVPPESMWHIRGPSWCGYVGLDMVHQARNAIGLALATEEYGSGLFKNGARPGGIISSKSPMSAETAERLKEAWERAQTGSGNAMKTAVMSADLSYQAISQTAEEAQFIETRKLIVQEVCRFMRVLPIMVMQSDDTTSYNSVEQMFIAHLTHTLMPWYRRIEQSMAASLLTSEERAEGYYVKFMAAGMMRGTAKERAEYLQIMRQNGIITGNDWREVEDMDRSSEPAMNEFILAANLYAPPDAAQPPPE
jgi:HK97 family phage portal protein